MPQVSSHLSQVRTSLRLLTRELRTAGSTDDFSYLSNDVGNVSIALANGETLPIQGTGTVSLPPLSCGQVMGSTANRDTDMVLDCNKWELLMSSIPAPRRTTERGGLGIVTSRPALPVQLSYSIKRAPSLNRDVRRSLPRGRPGAHLPIASGQIIPYCSLID